MINDFLHAPKKAKKIKAVENRHDRTKPTLVAGYKLTDVAKAPLQPPHPEKVETKAVTKGPKVKFLVAVGFALVLIGLIIILGTFSLEYGFVIMALGAAGVVAGVFLPIDHRS